MNLNSLFSSDIIMLITLALIAALLGFLLGILFTRLSLKGQNTNESQIRMLEEELAKYKSKVGDHFVETAELVNTMSQSYQSVYEHLQKGALGLVGEDVFQERLPEINKEPRQIENLEHNHKLTETTTPKPKESLVQVLKTKFNFKKGSSEGKS